jgi:uncharacterized protein
MSVFSVLILGVIGVLAGVLSGMFGVGGGMIIVPALMYFMHMSQHEAQGTSVGLMLLPIGILAASEYYKTGNLNVNYGLIIAVGFVFGGYIGSKISLNISGPMLKKIFGVLMFFVSVKLIFFSK